MLSHITIYQVCFSSFSLFFCLSRSLSPSLQEAYLSSLTPALGVWALTDSLPVTGAPRRYLPGLATLCAVVREWGREREWDTSDAARHQEIKPEWMRERKTKATNDAGSVQTSGTVAVWDHCVIADICRRLAGGVYQNAGTSLAAAEISGYIHLPGFRNV